LKAAFPAESVFVFRVEASGQPAMTTKTKFVSVDPDKAEIETTMFDANGTPAGEPKREAIKWSELVEHATFPASATTIEAAEQEVGIGRFDCWLYTVRQTNDKGVEQTNRYYFAKMLPGPPIQYETWEGSARVMVARMIERTGTTPAK
jgi:hypothetical protein